MLTSSASAGTSTKYSNISSSGLTSAFFVGSLLDESTTATISGSSKVHRNEVDQTCTVNKNARQLIFE